MNTKIVARQLNIDNDPLVEGTYYPPDKGFRWRGDYYKAGHCGYILIECPHCGKQHIHGWRPGEGRDRPSHRVAHCGPGSPGTGGYFIREAQQR